MGVIGKMDNILIFRYEIPQGINYRYAVTKDGIGYTAFREKKDFERWLKTLCIKIEKIDERVDSIAGRIEVYKPSESLQIIDTYFRSKDYEKIKNYKKVIGLSNGSKVDCYINKINDNVIEIYRPNPNDKDIYKEYDYFKTNCDI
jgi:hypothetical protein